MKVGGAYAGDLHLEDLLHRGFDFDLVRIARDLEGQSLVIFLQVGALLGNYRQSQDAVCFLCHRLSTSWTCRIASFEKMSTSWLTTS